MPPGGRRVGSDGKEFAGRKSGADLIEECEEICVAAGEWFDVELNAGEAWVSGEEFLDVGGEGGAPFGFVNAGAAAVGAADPGNDARALEGVEKTFDLICVHGREVAVGFGGAEVRE